MPLNAFVIRRGSVLVLLSAAKLYQHNSITVILLHLLPHRVLVTMCYAQGHHISPPLILPPLRVLIIIIIIIIKYPSSEVDRSSSVGITTRYGMDSPGI